ncbi:MAG: TRAP transporter large permease subunit [Pseudomonadota bacterium]
MLADLLDIAMFATLCGLLLLGYPVAFTLAGTALIFAALGALTGVFDLVLLHALPQRVFGIITNEILLAIPLFIFMGVLLERSDIARSLLASLTKALRGARGGTGVAVVLVGALLAASTGIVGATVVTLTMLAVPSLLARGYPPALTGGLVAASGTLGQVIPPSIVLIILAEQIGNAAQQASQSNPLAGLAPVSVGDLFAGALIPGLVLAALYALYVWWRSPTEASLTPEETENGDSLVQSLVAPLGLIFAVLGSVLAGLATPTEAASLGALGALMLAGLRCSPADPFIRLAFIAMLGLAVFILFAAGTTQSVALVLAIALTALLMAGLVTSGLVLARADILWPSVQRSLEITAMIFAIVIAASLFVLVFRGLGGDALVSGLLEIVPGGTMGAVLVVMLVMFVMGFFLDFLEIMFIVVPLAAPVLLQMPMPDGSPMNPVWLAVLIAVNLQTSFLTPPFGFALFYLRGSLSAETSKQISAAVLHRGVVPFVVIQLLVLVLLWLMPMLATWLPGVIYR